MECTHDRAGLTLRFALAVVLAATGCVPSSTDGGGQEAANGGATYHQQAIEATEIVAAPETGIDLGWGWDSFDSRPVPSVCVEFAERSEPAQTRIMTMHEVSDSYEVMQRMGMSAEASVKTIGFEASGKAAFAKELNITGFSSSFLLNASVDNGVRYAAPAPVVAGREISSGPSLRLTAEAAALARGRTLDEFQRRCGNAFVSAVYSGARLTAVLTIATESHQQQESLSAELSGSGWGARMRAKVEGLSTNADANERLDLSIFQVGGRGDAIPTSKEDLLEKLEILSALAFDAPKDFRIAVTPYEALANWPGKKIGGEEQEFDELASIWGAYNTLYDEFQSVLDAPTGFRAAGFNNDHCPAVTALDGATVERLKEAQDEVRAALHEIEDDARECVSRPASCTFDVTAYRSPYAFRAMLAVPDGAGASDGGEIAAYTITDPAKRRCDLDLRDPGCLSNAAIDSWAEKVGMIPLTFADPAEVDAVASAIPPTFESCAQKTFASFSLEAGFPVLWYHPEQAAATRGALASVRAELAEMVPVR